VRISVGSELVLVNVRNCGHARGIPVAWIVPRLEAIGCGGFNRNPPTGGWACGIPLKESIPSKLEPTTFPYSISTVGTKALFSVAGAASAKGRRHAAALRRDSIVVDSYQACEGSPVLKWINSMVQTI
jgi:hypothetical protein